jgi:hypothetical protein
MKLLIQKIIALLRRHLCSRQAPLQKFFRGGRIGP